MAENFYEKRLKHFGKSLRRKVEKSAACLFRQLLRVFRLYNLYTLKAIKSGEATLKKAVKWMFSISSAQTVVNFLEKLKIRKRFLYENMQQPFL